MIYDIINNIVFFVLANTFFSAFLQPRKESIAYKVSIISILIAIAIAVSVLFPETIAIRVLFAILENYLLAKLLYEGSVVKSLVLSVLFYAMVMSCDLLIISVWKIIDPDLRIATLMQNSLSVYMGAISQLIQMIIVFALKRIFSRHKNDDVDSKMWIVYLAFPVYSLIVIILQAYSFDGPINTFQTNTFTFMAVSLLIMNLFVYWFIKQEMRIRLTAQKDRIEISHAKEEFKLYEQMTNERDILGKREHEYKNMVTAVLKLAKDGHVNEAITILEKQNTELINNANVVETGNTILSAIFNAKYSEARAKDITVRIDIGDLTKVNLDERDSIVIFSNILNNAIESAEKCDENSRYIHIKALVENEQFVFSVHNSCNDASEAMQSSKHDVIPHGFGLDNIREAVERNEGNCYFEKQDGEFISVVIFLL